MSTGSHFDSWRRIIRLQDRYISLQITHPARERLGTPRGQRPLLLLVPDKWKCCEMGPPGFCPYILEVSRKSNRLQMSLRRQHLLLSNLKSLSFFPVGVWTRDLQLSRPALSWLSNLRSGVILFFFASLLLWFEREKNNAWYSYLTSSQTPPNLHNLTSSWPAMFLANKRLLYGNQILARIIFWNQF